MLYTIVTVHKLESTAGLTRLSSHLLLLFCSNYHCTYLFLFLVLIFLQHICIKCLCFSNQLNLILITSYSFNHCGWSLEPTYVIRCVRNDHRLQERVKSNFRTELSRSGTDFYRQDAVPVSKLSTEGKKHKKTTMQHNVLGTCSILRLTTSEEVITMCHYLITVTDTTDNCTQCNAPAAYVIVVGAL